MRIVDDLLSTVNQNAEVRDIRQGPFQTAVLTHGCGLASTPHTHERQRDHAIIKETKSLLARQVGELLKMSQSTNPFEAATGMAAINSLIEVDEQYCFEMNATDLLVEKGKGKKVALIGHFPFVPRLRQVAEELWVIERNPSPGDFTEEGAETLMPQADVVGITGTAFTNHTIEKLLGLCNRDAYVVILGGTAPLSPVLFDYGVSAVSGTKVVDPEAVLSCVSQGATFRQIRGIRLLTMMR